MNNKGCDGNAFFVFYMFFFWVSDFKYLQFLVFSSALKMPLFIAFLIGSGRDLTGSGSHNSLI